MKRKLKIIFFAVILPLLVLGGGMGALKHKYKEKTDPPRTAEVERGDVVVSVRETGTVEPIKQVEVKSKVSGQLKHLAVDEGDWVDEGDLIARLDVPQLEAQRDQVKAQLAGTTARVEQAELSCELDRQLIDSQIEQAAASLRAAKAALEEAATRVADAERVHANKRRLLDMGGFVSENEVDSAKATVDLAKQQRRSAEEHVRGQEAAMVIAEARRAECKLSESRVVEAQASLRQIQDALTEIEERLRDSVISAPCSGTVIVRHIREGELITAVSDYGAGAPIVTIGDLSTMLVKVYLNEVDVEDVRLEQAVTIKADAVRDRKYQGRVTKIAPAGGAQGNDPSSPGIVRFPIEITVDASSDGLMPGMTANAEIECQRAENVLWVPNDALFEKEDEEGKMFAAVVTGEEKGEQKTEDREVKLGLESDSRSEIVSGLKEGEKVQLDKSGIPERKTIDIRMQSERDEDEEE